MFELNPRLMPAINAYRQGILPDNLINEGNYLREITLNTTSPTDIDDPQFFEKLEKYSNARMESFRFHAETSEAGAYALISKQGAALIKDIANGRQVVDPFAGRGFIAKGLRDIDVEVIAGDLQPWNTVTEVVKEDCRTLIEKADKDALLLLAWAPRGLNDYHVASKWGKREILCIGDPGETTGSRKFANGFNQTRLIDSPDDILRHIHHEWSLGIFSK